jgi:hypothetical protein
MIIEENWDFYKDSDGYTTFTVSDLDEEFIMILIYSITQYLCMYDAEFHGDYNIENVCTIYEPNEPLKVEFLTNLPFELFEWHN